MQVFFLYVGTVKRAIEVLDFLIKEVFVVLLLSWLDRVFIESILQKVK